MQTPEIEPWILFSTMSADLLYERYKHIMPEPDAFLQTAGIPLPTTIWVNTLKITPSELKDSLSSSGVKLTALPWTNQAFRAESDKSMGLHWQFDAGFYRIQEEVSMLPVMALDPKPHETVLDMCAAPGSKTSQIAIAMQNCGTLIANDRNYQRMRTLGKIVQRLGLINCHLTIYDAMHFPRVNNYFDKILVDAPCSCEGTFRKSSNKSVAPCVNKSRSLAHKQLAFLSKAFKFCKTGGRIVYSTCTFSPEENEKVVARFLQTYPGQLKLINIDMPGFHLTPGLTRVDGVTLPDALSKTKRIWPQLNNTGGFYYALFEKVSDYHHTTTIMPFQTCDSPEVRPFLIALCERFGIQLSHFDRFKFTTHSRRGIYLVAADTAIPDNLKYDNRGLFFIKTNLKHPKLSSAAMAWLYPEISKNKLTLSEQQCAAYQSGQTIQLSEQQARLCDSTGYVAVTYQDRILPQGIYLSAYAGQGPRVKMF